MDEPAGKTPTPFLEIGTTGLKQWAGFIREEFLTTLQGARGMKVYREMRDNSAIVGACLSAIEMLIRRVRWWVEPASDDPEDRRRAAFVEECRGDMSTTWPETIAEHLTMLPYGWALHEIVYKRRLGDVNDPTGRSRFGDGLVGWRKVPLRSQETLAPVEPWLLDPNGGIQGFRQSAAPDYAIRTIPIAKALLFRARTERNNPEGRSVLRSAYFSWYFAKKIAEIEGIGIARDLTGIPIAWIPIECFDLDATAQAKATRAEMEKIVTTVARDEQEGLVMPLDFVAGTSNKRYDLTLLSTGGRRQFDTSAIIERYERRIAMTMLADIVLMGHEQVGSYALSSDKKSLLVVGIDGWLDAIAEIYNLHAIPRLLALNGWPQDRSPRLRHAGIDDVDLAALGDFISKIAGAGYKWDWDAGVDEHLRRAARFPLRPTGRAPNGQVLGPDGKPAGSAPTDEGAA